MRTFLIGAIAAVAFGCSSETQASPKGVEHVDAAGAAALLASDPSIVPLDVRTPGEHAEGHIDGCTLVDFMADDFEGRVGELDREQRYLVYCRSGGRSTKALAILDKLGFERIVHLDGGFLAWSEAGQKSVR